MLAWTGQILLVTTALAPAVLVWAATYIPTDLRVAGWLAGASALAALLCLCLVRFLQEHGGVEQTNIASVKNVNREVLAFLVSYVLPLLARKELDGNLWAIGTALALIGLALYQAEMHYVNPLLGLLGYRFFEVETASGQGALLLARKGQTPGKGALAFIRVSESVWLRK